MLLNLAISVRQLQFQLQHSDFYDVLQLVRS
jgi:hypothetical protein